MDSDNEDLKKEVLSGKTSISAGYKELTQSTDEPNSAQRKIIKMALQKEKIIVVRQPLIRLSKRIGVYLFG